jgi:hypothetical protein
MNWKEKAWKWSWERRNMHTGFFRREQNVKERVHLKDLGVDGI